MRRISVIVVMVLLLTGCASSGITPIGPVATTGITCYTVKDRDLVIALGLILCEKDGKVVGTAGGAASGLGHGIAPVLGAALLGAGMLEVGADHGPGHRWAVGTVPGGGNG